MQERLPHKDHLGARLRRTGFPGFAPSRCASRPFGFNPPLALLGCPLRAPLALRTPAAHACCAACGLAVQVSAAPFGNGGGHGAGEARPRAVVGKH